MSYHKNSLANNTPSTSTAKEGGFVHYQEKVEGRKIHARSESFKIIFHKQDYFGTVCHHQKSSISLDAFSFEVGKVKSQVCRQQVVDMFVHVDKEMATTIADNVGVNRPTGEQSKVNGIFSCTESGEHKKSSANT